MRTLRHVAALVPLFTTLSAQEPVPPAAKREPPAAAAPAAVAVDPADVASVEAIVAALYDVISGPAGQTRDWDRMRSLFHPQARLVPVVKGASGMRAVFLTVDDYVRRSGPVLERDGFFEREVARRVDVFGDLAQVFSTYEGKRREDDEIPFLRGINSIQLVRQDGRWFVLQILWEQEADAGPIPAAYRGAVAR